jgi:hypothetical protein
MSGLQQDNRPAPSSVEGRKTSRTPSNAPVTHGRRGLDLNTLSASDFDKNEPASRAGRRWAKVVVALRLNRKYGNTEIRRQGRL